MAARELNTVQKPFVLPVSRTTPDDFGLGDRDHNQQQAERLLSAPFKVLREDRTVLVGSALHSGLGEIFICRKDESALTYYLRYEVEQVEPLGIAAMQVAVWRRAAPGLLGGTSGIIYTLLDDHDAIVSHPSITLEGERYWLDRMAEAFEEGWAVGVTDGDTLLQYGGKRSLLDWVHALGETGDNGSPQRKCFFIARATRSADRP